jgi:hypothetical protein
MKTSADSEIAVKQQSGAVDLMQSDIGHQPVDWSKALAGVPDTSLNRP